MSSESSDAGPADHFKARPMSRLRATGIATHKIVEAVLSVWPDHQKFVAASFSDPSVELARTREMVAGLLLQVGEARAKPLTSWATDYRFLCEKIVLPEELHFRRHERYRVSTFEEAARTVYNNAEFMSRYMNGLFVVGSPGTELEFAL